MEYIHIKNLEKYHPGYKDRDLKWAKLYFTMVQGDPEFEVIKDEIDKWRFAAMICLELEAKKPLLNTDEYWVKKFDVKKRSMSMTLQMLHNFIEVVTEETKLCSLDKSKSKIKNKIEECVTQNNNIPQEIYSYYSKTIKPGAKEDAIRNITKLLKTLTKEDLMGRIDAYRKQLDSGKQTRDPQYYIQANNFFGRAARYKDFELVKKIVYKPADPECKLCKGQGKVMIANTSEIKICSCRQP